jgi:hypothetical protein
LSFYSIFLFVGSQPFTSVPARPYHRSKIIPVGWGRLPSSPTAHMVNKTTKARKRPLSSTAKAITRAQPSVSSKVTQGTISTYHTLIKRRAQLERRLASAEAAELDAIQRALDSVSQDLLRLGGIDAYQKASQLGQSSARGGDSSKVLVEWLHGAGYGRGSEASIGKGKGKAGDMEQSCDRLR